MDAVRGGSDGEVAASDDEGGGSDAEVAALHDEVGGSEGERVGDGLQRRLAPGLQSPHDAVVPQPHLARHGPESQRRRE
jgi:hypothetical protein